MAQETQEMGAGKEADKAAVTSEKEKAGEAEVRLPTRRPAWRAAIFPAVLGLVLGIAAGLGVAFWLFGSIFSEYDFLKTSLDKANYEASLLREKNDSLKSDLQGMCDKFDKESSRNADLNRHNMDLIESNRDLVRRLGERYSTPKPKK